ncbi:MAG: sulfite exporter TauE/SafE family protein [Bryobacterales bacterium]|nr:sulfite exporter TauE/SafE family protein [Bryobacterales bacterium]
MAAVLLVQAQSRLGEFLARDWSDPAFAITALGVAFSLGAAHALTPGHGKAIVAAYLAGTKGRVSDAVLLGGVVTATHTASVFALGLVALYATSRLSPAQILPWLSLTSGLLVLIVGVWLLVQRVKALRHPHHHHHSHSHGHSHDHPHHSHDGAAHEGRGGLFSLGISGGLVPCPEALVVLMIALSLGRLLHGLVVLLAFSAGLAAVLIALAVATVLARPVLETATGQARWTRVVPVASAGIIVIAGAVLVLGAAREFAGKYDENRQTWRIGSTSPTGSAALQNTTCCATLNGLCACSRFRGSSVRPAC